MYHDYGPTHQLARQEMVARRTEAAAHRLRKEVSVREAGIPPSSEPWPERPAAAGGKSGRLVPRRRYLALFPRG
jgi:hypothetical protein